MFNQFVIIFIIFFGGNHVQGKFPTYINRCKIDDEKCMIAVTEGMLQKYEKTGIKEFDVEQFDPYYLDHISTSDTALDAPGEFNMQFELDDAIVHGISKAKVHRLQFKRKNDKLRILIHFQMPNFEIHSKYSVKGVLLDVLPIEGKGDANCTIKDPYFVFKISANLVERQGEKFIDITKFQIRYNTTLMSVYLSNLFDGNEELGKTINEFINNNWKELFGSFSRLFFEIFGVAFRTAVSRIFKAISFDEMFL